MKTARNNLHQLHFSQHLELNINRRSKMASKIKNRQFLRWVRSALLPGFRRTEVSINIVESEESQNLNQRWRGKNSPTNVLSFALNEGETVLGMENILSGDLIFCASVIEQEAKLQGKTELAHYAHLTIHGMLHLQGYDHQNDAEAEIMEQIETQIMLNLGYSNPYN